eukprot:TRINITY_DN9310_c0_g1_i1.p1 TRINITY_DN9310_c0_g1~~TRINITY_DN9310_c0_g1_i1.p1  ORF type:complete len:94 (-),score=6.60 TRINITY_DN9310_c0_g1_i1:282-563(-)
MVMNGLTGARTRNINEIDFSRDDRKMSIDILDEYDYKAETVEINNRAIISRDYQYGKISKEIRELFEEGRPELRAATCRYAGGLHRRVVGGQG